ncbi:MAG: hypothetical protein JXB14_01285 [Candidatus Altiarchaeota archaeon]|nr:hypothetical protein [Candidatus Altiarchaeota archaeon]
MRLWAIHPKYLDAKGLVALWREGLLAKKVLEGETEGYRNHPELDLFKCQGEPAACVNSFLLNVWEEADRRGYDFDRGKIKGALAKDKVEIGRGAVIDEFEHLKNKLKKRDPIGYKELLKIDEPELNPMFVLVD